ncbi:hypothetical protein F5884DRAFT_803245 [Xylogone sp. PMI_703]|nr:hypothetical protein F5884DRAFT_803245 [Xylogone sp. PMI_703]
MIVLITGPSEGSIGAESAISLARAGPKQLLLLGRNKAKVEPTIKAISEIDKNIDVKFFEVDLSSLESVRKAAQAILFDSTIPTINVIINNAGIMACPYEKSVDGIEMQFAANHLGHFLLTNLLLPKLRASGPHARIVNVSSWGHAFSDVRFDDVNFNDGKDYLPQSGYGQSKTANVLHAVGLNKRLAGSNVRAYALHPGSIASGLQKYATPELMKAAIGHWEKVGRPMPGRKTLQQGCSTHLRAALDPSLESSSDIYLQDCQLTSDPANVYPYCLDPEAADKLWELSEKLVGQKFSI